MTKLIKNCKIFKLMKMSKPKVFVAMSGGVDSSVAAALLKKQGYFVVGVFFRPWTPPATSFCQWEQDRLDAMRVAAKLGIEFKTWDFSKEYSKHVAQYMIDGYRAGITPNPDVMCNKEIKFGLFLKKALEEGAGYIATGHYVRSRSFTYKSDRIFMRIIKLLRAKDLNKDQSYFLWTLTQNQLKHCLFPIGNYTKPEIRKLAKKFGLPNHAKKDSQGVCFIGQLDMKEFLTNYIKPKRGEIRLAGSNAILGWHDGVYYYTIGQRQGLNINNGQGPYFVAAKNVKENILYVADEIDGEQLKVNSCRIVDQSWINKKPKLPIKADVKIRYRTEALPAMISANSRGLFVKFQKPAKAITPGQSAVIYKGQEMLGGGIIV